MLQILFYPGCREHVTAQIALYVNAPTALLNECTLEWCIPFLSTSFKALARMMAHAFVTRHLLQDGVPKWLNLHIVHCAALKQQGSEQIIIIVNNNHMVIVGGHLTFQKAGCDLVLRHELGRNVRNFIVCENNQRLAH